VDPFELVREALNGFSKPWEMFVRGIVAKEHVPTWEGLWDEFLQEDLRFGSRYSSQQHGMDDEGDISLLEKGNKKTKKAPKGGTKNQHKGDEQKKDMSKVK